MAVSAPRKDEGLLSLILGVSRLGRCLLRTCRDKPSSKRDEPPMSTVTGSGETVAPRRGVGQGLQGHGGPGFSFYLPPKVAKGAYFHGRDVYVLP